jgi:hypothetical protein
MRQPPEIPIGSATDGSVKAGRQPVKPVSLLFTDY